jgi:hypothetical protein
VFTYIKLKLQCNTDMNKALFSAWSIRKRERQRNHGLCQSP